jgi:hypothetical protein
VNEKALAHWEDLAAKERKRKRKKGSRSIESKSTLIITNNFH